MTEEGPKKRRSTAAEKLARRLRERISSGVYRPHAYLPPLRSLVSEFGASPRTVSAALRILAAEKLTVQTRGRGTRVLPPQERLSRNVIGLTYAPPRNPLAVGSGQMRIVEGIQQTLLRNGYTCEPVNLNDTPMTLDELQERFGALAIVQRVGADEEMRELERRRLIYVVANLERHALELSATWTDHCKTTLEAVRVLTSLGHRRIALVTRSSEHFFYDLVWDGYVAGLKEEGIEPDTSLVVESERPDNLSAYIAARQLLRLRPLPTAIVAARDYLAHGAYQAFTEAGHVVGRDISLIGGDDVTWPDGREFLTTFHEPNYKMGAVAAEMLIDRIVHGWKPVEKRRIESKFVLRRSAAPIAAPVAPQPASEG